MPYFTVRFKGMLTREERERLATAGIAIEGSEPSLRTGPVQTGRPIYTARVEADSAERAVVAVREALEPDSGNFSGWDAGPA
jgi:hypothetical protein